ncbi:MAG: carbohydrate ABC transporter permease [Firmicutes bacterium]|nr:carbohydrate ABC transporter permease [Bacillota bacterium]
MSIRRSFDQKFLSLIAYIIVGLFALIALLPFYVLVVSSFTSEHAIVNYGYTFFPREFSIDAYKLVFLNPLRILRAYGVTILVTSVGTALSLLLASMAAYTMYRKDVKYRNHLAFFLYFTTLFNGGLASYYIILSKYLHLKNTIFVLLLVPMFNVLWILILRNFLRGSIPDELVEAGKIDGLGDFGIYLRIILPLFKPALASIGLFTALQYWNDWWTPMMFVEREALWPLQYVLYQILSSVNITANMINNLAIFNLPKESLKLALTVVSTGPIIFLYPFVQKYFVRGITLGSIKG